MPVAQVLPGKKRRLKMTKPAKLKPPEEPEVEFG
jgi:hypothetical protein